MNKLLVIRIDGNPQIGSGHVMRCSAIARQAMEDGSHVLFAVSDDVSRARVEQQGFNACVIEGDALAFDRKDGAELAAFARDRGATAILVDSYAVTDGFFSGLYDGLSGSGIRVGYMDDAYTFEYGILDHPHKWPVDVLVNYTFGFSVSDYRTLYGAETKCLIGPQFAPIRPGFSSGKNREIFTDVRRALVTTGSTNPNGVLERLVAALVDALPGVQLDVVVGGQAEYVGKTGTNINLLHNVQDMASLMCSCDMAVSAAGSTLYELCATGTPSIAVPIVENQIKNVQGFVEYGVGLGLTTLAWDDVSVAEIVCRLSDNEGLRVQLSTNASLLIDGLGAGRVAQNLRSCECMWV